MNPAISRIFISNLNFRATEADVRNLLEAYGTVQRVTIVKDRATAASRSFGFVEMQGAAEAAIAALHGSTHAGRTLRVELAKPKPQATAEHLFSPQRAPQDSSSEAV